jgi:Ca2+-binding EF-hand superfamily protein
MSLTQTCTTSSAEHITRMFQGEGKQSDMVTFDNFSNILQSTGVSTDITEQLDIWRYFSKNKSDTMTASEFKDAVIKFDTNINGLIVEKDLIDIFTLIDTDGGGKIDKADYDKFVISSNLASVNITFEELGPDSDGFITLKQFLNEMESVYHK